MEKRKSAPVLLDSNLVSWLRIDSKPFIGVLGEPQLEEQGFSFSVQNLPFHHFTIGYALNKKFLGKIYLMTLEGLLSDDAPVLPSGTLELRYSGFIKKGKPFFVTRRCSELKEPESRIGALLNNDQNLLEECWKLEIEFLKILFDSQEPSCKIQVRPYGGSLIRIIMPPLHYHVRLIPEQAILILAVMKRIAGIIKDFNK